jgi:hypothetical protein
MSSAKDVKQLLKLAKKLQYEIKLLKNNHYQIKGNNHLFGVASTPGNANTVTSIKNRIIRLGPNLFDTETPRWHP